MLRIFSFCFSCLLFITAAHAQGEDPSEILDKGALQQAIYDGDVPLVEAMIGDAHNMYLSGDAEPDDMRVIFQLFTTTNPKVIDFTENWLNQSPNSVYAHTAQAWIYFNKSWNVRGPNFARQTYPPALREFRRLQEATWHHAWAAYVQSPDFIPATDALLRTAVQLGRTGEGLDLIEEIMEDQPNMGSLYRAVGMTHPGWTRHTWDRAEWLCETYAPMIEWSRDEDPLMHCLIDAAMTIHESTHRDWGYEMLVQGFAPSLDFYRLNAATWHTATRTEAEFAHAYLTRPDVTNYRFARQHDEYIAMRYGFEFISHDHLLREQEIARAQLEHDPYNPDLIKTLSTDVAQWTRSADSGVTVRLIKRVPESEQIDLAQRLLISAPYDPENWRNFLGKVGRGLRPETFQAYDPFFNNVVVYSNHSPDSLAYLLGNKAQAHKFLGMAKTAGLPDWDEVLARKDWTNDIFCPTVRAYRLREHVCESVDGHACTQNAEFEAFYEMAMAQSAQDNICTWERTTPIRDLFFKPILMKPSDFAPEGRIKNDS
ncbi:MAG: hypothetical protein AAF280_10175 [Pseudomonadota bacterium]